MFVSTAPSGGGASEIDCRTHQYTAEGPEALLRTWVTEETGLSSGESLGVVE